MGKNSFMRILAAVCMIALTLSLASCAEFEDILKDKIPGFEGFPGGGAASEGGTEKPDEGKPNDGKPDDGKPNDGKPNEGKPGEGGSSEGDKEPPKDGVEDPTLPSVPDGDVNISDTEFYEDGDYYEEGSSKGLRYRSRGDGTCEVNSLGSCSDVHIVIPKISPRGETVVHIGTDAFMYLPDEYPEYDGEDSDEFYEKSRHALVKSVFVPDTVDSISDFVFAGLYNLESVSFPATLERIGNDVFTACKSLLNINVDPENTYFKSIDGVLYNGDVTVLLKYPIGRKDTSFTVPDGVETIYRSAFLECHTIEEVVMADSVKLIDSAAFSCFGLKRVVFGKNSQLEEIKNNVFLSCFALESFDFPDGVKKIGGGAFDRCESLKSVVIPPLVEVVEWGVFRNCKKLESVSFASGSRVKEIYYSVFEYCESLKTVTLPEGLLRIKDGAFDGCHSLENLVIPASVEEVHPLIVGGILTTTITFKDPDGWQWAKTEGDDRVIASEWVDIPRSVMSDSDAVRKLMAEIGYWAIMRKI